MSNEKYEFWPASKSLFSIIGTSGPDHRGSGVRYDTATEAELAERIVESGRLITSGW